MRQRPLLLERDMPALNPDRLCKLPPNDVPNSEIEVRARCPLRQLGLVQQLSLRAEAVP